MKAAIGLLSSLVLIATIACSGGGDGSGGSEDDAEARANEVVLTYFEVFAGKKEPQALLDLFAPECRQGVDSTQISAVVELIRTFLPELAEADIEAVDLGDLDVEETADGFRVAPSDPDAMRFRVNGEFVNAQEYMAGLIGGDAGSFTSVPGEGQLTLIRRDGKLYVGDCEELQDIAG